MIKRPGAELATRPLNFYWVVDCSGSMYGEKIGTVSHAIQSVVPEMQHAADENPSAQLFVQTLKFSSGATWVNPEPVKVENFYWQDLGVDGLTDMGKAFELLAGQLSVGNMGEKALPPVLVLLTDGHPTDDYKPALDKLLNLPWGKKAVRIAIAIGQDCNEAVLEEFTGNRELVLHANSAADLVRMIKWASTAASMVSQPKSMAASDGASPLTTLIDVNQIPVPDMNIAVDDVW